MSGNETLVRIMRLAPPELAHQLALRALRLPWLPRWRSHHDPFDWHGLRFRNRVGIAAGFDKNGVALRGIESLGVGFIEVGTILVKPWRGNELRPRIKRLAPSLGIWNRLGFPSHGVESISRNLKSFPRPARHGIAIGCNIGPHPGNLKGARSVADYLEISRAELCQLVEVLFEDTDFFVVNLSSPNTSGLRDLFKCEDLSACLFLPLRQVIERLAAESARPRPAPLLVKLPPEDADRNPWTSESLRAVVEPIVACGASDGFVAVNTSSRLAAELGEESGGVSGGPLRSVALQVVELLRRLVGPQSLVIGSGGITDPEHAAALIEAGSDLVEIYSGLVYRGPGLLESCAAALRERNPLSSPLVP
jgi:dihydroorotate dehydrogenase